MIRLALLAFVLAACSPSQTSVTRSESPPGDAYTCALRVLEEMDYTVVDTDRSAGFIRSEKGDGVGALVPGVEYFTEITVLVLSVPAGGSDMQITVSRSKEEGSEPRSSAGMALTDRAERDAEHLGSQCSQAP